jgi:hypothetical protein
MFLLKPILDTPAGLRAAVVGGCLMAGLLWAARAYRERGGR